MSTESNKAIARRFVDAINTGNEAAFLDVLAPDVVDHYGVYSGYVQKSATVRA